jgi:hypothetical protein
MSIYYYTLDDLTFPLLFLGMFLALLQLPVNTGMGDQVASKGWSLIRRLASELTLVWLIFASILGVYISFKVIMTAIGWIAIKNGTPSLFGSLVPDIDDKLGIGCVLAILIFSVVTVYKVIKWRRGKANKSHVSKSGNDKGEE